MFWQLIETNRKNCQTCQDQNCLNRYFLLQLKNTSLSENDLYLLTYMTTYFLDLIMSVGRSKCNLSMAFYILSKGHDDVMSFLGKKKPMPKTMKEENLDKYEGYLLGVLYYLIPNFKYSLIRN